MRWSALLFICVAMVARGQPSQDSGQALPAFKVWPLFTLTVPGPPRSAENVFSFRTVDDVSPERWRGFKKFRSTSLQSGDQVVAIEGKLVSEMQPNEGRRLLSFAEPGKKISLDVRQPGSKKVRKAIVVRLDVSDEIER